MTDFQNRGFMQECRCTGFVLAMIIVWIPTKAQGSLLVNSKNTTTVRLGEDTVNIVVYSSTNPGPTYFAPHDDETTCVQVGRQFVAKYGGRLIDLNQSGKREIMFRDHGDFFAFDPNRIFTTDRAIINSLEMWTCLRFKTRFSCLPSARRQDVVAIVKTLRDQLLQLISRDTTLVVALHNNTEGRLSINSYRRRGAESKNAALVSRHRPRRDPDDFFLVTFSDAFRYLDVHGANVTLQDNVNAKNNGSLSIWAGRNGVRYINIEAQHGHFDTQCAMLQDVIDFYDNGHFVEVTTVGDVTGASRTTHSSTQPRRVRSVMPESLE